MKRLILTVFVLLLVLLAVMLGRAASIHTIEYPYSRAPELELDRRMLSTRLSHALQLRTVSTRERDAFYEGQLSAMLDFVEEHYPRVIAGTEYERHEANVVFRWQGSEPGLAPLLMLAHLDVVPIEPGTEDDWTWPPFSGEVSAGTIWGRGALDDKSSALAMLEAVNHLMGEGVRPRRTVVLAFGNDEEIGGERGARAQAARFAEEGLAPFLILDEGQALLEGLVPGVEATVGAVGIAEKGYATLNLVVQSEGGHASMPPRQTAVGILGAALARLEETPCSAKFDEPAAGFLEALAAEMPFAQKTIVSNRWITAPLIARMLSKSPETDALLRSTTAATMTTGGVAENVLPEHASAAVNFRIHPRDSVADIVAHAQDVIDDERVDVQLVEGAWEASASSPTDSEAWWLLHRSIAESFDDVIVAPCLVLGATDSRHYAGLSPNVYRFSPLRLQREDLARLHGTNERITISDYVAMIRFYVQLMRNA